MFEIFLSIGFFVISLIISFVVLFRNYRGRLNWSFFLFSVSIASWQLFSALSDLPRTLDLALLFAKLAMVGPPISFSFLLFFSLIFPRDKYKVPNWAIFIIFFPAVLMELFVPTKYNISSATIESWGFSYEPGYLFVALFLMAIVYLGTALFVLYKKYSREKGIARDQIRYFLSAIFTSAAIGVTTNIILPLGHYSRLAKIGPSLTMLALNFILAYAIVRYRLMSIRIVIQRIVVNFSLFIIFSFLLYFVIKFETFTNLLIFIPSYLKALIAAGSVVIAYPVISKLFINYTNRYFAKGNFDYAEVVHMLSDTILLNLDLDMMMDKALKIISEALGVERSVFLLHDPGFKKLIAKKGYSAGDAQYNHFSLEISGPLAQYLNKRKEITISEELEIRLQNNLIPEEDVNLTIKTIKELDNLKVYLCQPVIKGDRLTAAICFGDKKSGDSFSTNDIKLIDTFANQLALAIENFVAYEELKTKKEQLEKSMKLMVGRELEMINMKKRLNQIGTNK